MTRQALWKRGKWLLLLIPLGVISVPLLLFGMLIGTRLLSIVAGPVNIWNTVWLSPPAIEVAGYYRISDESWKDAQSLGVKISKNSGFTLTADHRMEIFDVPAFDGFGKPLNCSYVGAGEWSSNDSGGGSTNAIDRGQAC